MVHGRYLNYKDNQNFEKVVVLGNKVKTDLFKNGEDPIGKYVQISDINFKVIGVYSDPGGEREEARVFLPLSTSQRVFSGANEIGNMAFTLQKKKILKTLLLLPKTFQPK